jgi:hypothetical protein
LGQRGCHVASGGRYGDRLQPLHQARDAGAVYASTLAVLVDDESEGKAETLAFLDRRIEGIMRFEKAKSRLFRADREHFSVVRLLGRLRYPVN